MRGKNAAKFKQSISDIIESMSDEIYILIDTLTGSVNLTTSNQ